MIKILVSLLCLFVPVSSWRKKIRLSFVGLMTRPKRMRRFNKIAKWKIEKIDGIKVASGKLQYGKDIHLAHIFDKDITPAYISHEIFNNHEYHFSANRPAVVIDIGMNYGYASLYFAVRDDVEVIYAFEPVKETYDKAVFGFSLNEIAKKITPYNYGLSDRDKEIKINFNPTGSGSTSTMENRQHLNKPTITVLVKDAASEINAIVADHPDKRIVIKCDCEGAEKEIFARLDEEKILPFIDIIIMEYHNNYDKNVEPLLTKNKFVYFKDTRSSYDIIRAVNQNPMVIPK